MKKIYIGSDHAGFILKNSIKTHLTNKKHKFIDLGNLKYEKEDDYPDYAEEVAKKVAKEKTKGILICGSSHGVCIAANKIKGIRAVAINNTKDAKITREHNDANILCLSEWHLKEKEVGKIIDVWLKTNFRKDKRHIRRINKIKKLER
ncbi:MAG: ribose 5-phosphate isomerase B [Candidatus Woesearchaeota archaeon]